MNRLSASWLLGLLVAGHSLLACPSGPSFAAEPGDEPAAEAPLTAEEMALIRAAEEARIRAIESVYGSVVMVYGNDRQGGGSGVVFHPCGWALTNHHVVAAAGTEGWAGLADGKLYRWKLVGTDPGGDLAIIHLEGRDDFPAAPLGNSDRVRVGQWAMAMGNPFVLAEDQRPTVTLGIVSGVERYQEGAGNNMLVYGNCIQVDSSINPGNSGGPLFNLAGEVIGINGRGSFEERGRVNVGLGYAISVNQTRIFIPELLATKVAQHGTLDAIFGNRRAGVLCERINLDGAAARGGLKLGDRLIAFEGREIENANQFTNLISTLPADWPVELVVDRGGVSHTLRFRLAPLPYGPVAAEPEPQPEEQPGEEQPEEPKEEPEKAEGEEEPSEEQPGEPRQIEIPAGPQISLERPGVVQDEARNAANARLLWELCRTGGEAVEGFTGALELEASIVERDREIGRLKTYLSEDGRWRVEQFNAEGLERVWGYDGEAFWQQTGDTVETLRPIKACSETAPQQAAVLAAWLARRPLSTGEEVRIAAADKAAGRLTCRFRALTSDNDEWFLWLALPGPAAEEPTHGAAALVKSGLTLDGEGLHPGVLYGDWREAHGVQVPHRISVVQGLAETPLREYRIEAVEHRAAAAESVFAKPEE